MKWSTVIRAGSAAAVVATVASQHPNPAFNVVKSKDTLSVLIPNWRFFAPDPARHDYEVYFRTGPDEESPWIRLHVITERQLRQLVWFPERRAEKGLFDMVSELLTSMSEGMEAVTRGTPYRMLLAIVRRRIAAEQPDATDFQFAIIRHGGYDETEPIDVIFVSPRVPVVPAAQEVPA